MDLYLPKNKSRPSMLNETTLSIKRQFPSKISAHNANLDLASKCTINPKELQL